MQRSVSFKNRRTDDKGWRNPFEDGFDRRPRKATTVNRPKSAGLSQRLSIHRPEKTHADSRLIWCRQSGNVVAERLRRDWVEMAREKAAT